MKSLAAAALATLAVAGCGSPHPGNASASPTSRSTSPCSPSPSLSPASPGAPVTAGFSVVISQGQTIQRQATVNPQQLLFSVHISWNEGDVHLSLTTPSGKVYDRATMDPNANHHVQANAESFSIHNPESGQWAIQLFGASIRATGEQVGVSLTQMPLSAFAPIAVFSASTDRGIAPLEVQFSGHADGFNGATIASYRWDFGDCSPFESAADVTHVFRTAGSYTVTLTATDSNGQTDSATQDVFVSATDQPPTATFIWASLDPKNPNMMAFDAESSNDVDGQITTYSWDFGDGASGTGRIPTHSYSKAGSYRVKLTVTDNGGLSASACQMVTTGKYGTTTQVPCT
jgi:PKD repeat protein